MKKAILSVAASLFIIPLFPVSGHSYINVQSNENYASVDVDEQGVQAHCDSGGNCWAQDNSGMSYQQTVQAVQSTVGVISAVSDVMQTVEAGNVQREQFQAVQLQNTRQAQALDQNYMNEIKTEKEQEFAALRKEKEEQLEEKQDEVMSVIQGENASGEGPPYSFQRGPRYDKTESTTPDAKVSEPEVLGFKPSSSGSGKESSEKGNNNCAFGICSNPSEVTLEGQGASDSPHQDTSVVDLRDKTDLIVADLKAPAASATLTPASQMPGLDIPGAHVSGYISSDGVNLRIDIPPNSEIISPASLSLIQPRSEEFPSWSECYLDRLGEKGKEWVVGDWTDYGIKSAKGYIESKIEGSDFGRIVIGNSFSKVWDFGNTAYGWYEEAKGDFDILNEANKEYIAGFKNLLYHSAAELANPYDAGDHAKQMQEGLLQGSGHNYNDKTMGMVYDKIRGRAKGAMDDAAEAEEE